MLPRVVTIQFTIALTAPDYGHSKIISCTAQPGRLEKQKTQNQMKMMEEI